MRIPAAAYNGFFRIAGGCRSGRNHLFVLLFRDIEQVEAVVRYRSDAVVFHGDRTGQGVVVPEQASAVEAVEQVVGELQHPPGSRCCRSSTSKRVMRRTPRRFFS